jgi:small redox-active disulfide protein 2
MNIKILGTGCAKCKKLMVNTEEAIKIAGVAATVEKIEDLNKISDYGVMITPGLVIDEEVKSVGKLLSPQQIADLLKSKSD